MTETATIEVPRHPALRVGEVAGKGRGLIAGRPLANGELLEVAPVIPMKAEDGAARSSILFDYPFAWDDAPYLEAIALGAISMANHSREPNARFEPDLPGKVIRLFALREIAAGEEITIDYGIELWFAADQ